MRTSTLGLGFATLLNAKPGLSIAGAAWRRGAAKRVCLLFSFMIAHTAFLTAQTKLSDNLQSTSFTHPLYQPGQISAPVSEESGQAVYSEFLRRDFWDVHGDATAVLATNGLVYVGGRFNYVSTKGRKLSVFDIYTGLEDPAFPAIEGRAIHAIVPDGAGGWYMGGLFVSVGGVPRTNLVHILPNYTVDPNFAPNPNDRVRSLTLVTGLLYVGGDFTAIADLPRARLAALDLRTGIPTGWNPQANDRVYRMEFSHGRFYVGGDFTFVGNQPRNRLAALDSETGRATAWNPGADGRVSTLVVDQDRIYLGGSFLSVGGQRRVNLAAVDINTGGILPWNPSLSGQFYNPAVSAIAVVCDTVYVGGSFTFIGGQARTNAAALDADTGLAKEWNPRIHRLNHGFVSGVLALQVVGNTVYLGGFIGQIGDQLRYDIAVVDRITGELTSWAPNANNGVTSGCRRIKSSWLSSRALAARNALIWRPLMP